MGDRGIHGNLRLAKHGHINDSQYRDSALLYIVKQVVPSNSNHHSPPMPHQTPCGDSLCRILAELVLAATSKAAFFDCLTIRNIIIH